MSRDESMMKEKNVLTAGKQRGFLSSRQAFVLLGLMFMAPAFVAWVMHNSTEEGWRPDGTTNRGILVHPARPLTLPADMEMADVSVNDYLRGKGSPFDTRDADCDAVCNGNLYKMRQVNIAQNENMKRVQRLYLVEGAELPGTLDELLEKEYPKMDVGLLSPVQAEQIAQDFLVDGVRMQGAERIYIVDPLGNLMMYYSADANPSGMLKDLKKLLKYSKIG